MSNNKMISSDRSSSSESKVYDVEEIIDHRYINGKKEYLVKWEGYPRSESTWEPLIHLENVQDLVEKYNKRLKRITEDVKKQRETKKSLDKVGRNGRVETDSQQTSKIEKTKSRSHTDNNIISYKPIVSPNYPSHEKTNNINSVFIKKSAPQFPIQEKQTGIRKAPKDMIRLEFSEPVNDVYSPSILNPRNDCPSSNQETHLSSENANKTTIRSLIEAYGPVEPPCSSFTDKKGLERPQIAKKLDKISVEDSDDKTNSDIKMTFTFRVLKNQNMIISHFIARKNLFYTIKIEGSTQNSLISLSKSLMKKHFPEELERYCDSLLATYQTIKCD